MNGTTKRNLEEEGNDVDQEEDDDDQPLLAPRKLQRKVVPGEQCPFLDTISRQNLDFDFEKCCSISLSRVNVYACLVCGSYFQGRGPGTHAHTHSVEEDHHLFMNLEDGRVFCIPENYEVVDRSLKDIQHILNPLYTPEDVKKLAGVQWARTLDGSDYMPGLVGLNNMKRNDYANVIIQSLVRVPKLRDFFLIPANYADSRSDLVRRFGELMRKVWDARAFRGQVSPHEFLQAVIAASQRAFTTDAEADPVAFWTWLLNALHLGLTNGARKKRSVITQCFQGQLEVTTLQGTGAAADAEADLVERKPFFMLTLELPQARLFQDAVDKDIIPQVQIFELLQKFNGERITDDVAAGRRRFRVRRLPPYLAMSVRRFTKNRFFIEKNPTIVNFPVKNLDMHCCLPPPDDGAAGRGKAKDSADKNAKDGAEAGDPGDVQMADAEDVAANDANDAEAGEGGKSEAKFAENGAGQKNKKKGKGNSKGGASKTGRSKEQAQSTLYNLVASVSHVGSQRPDGVYKGYLHRAAEGAWYEVQDLILKETVPEAVVISEAYLQVYERQQRR